MESNLNPVQQVQSFTLYLPKAHNSQLPLLDKQEGDIASAGSGETVIRSH